MTNSEIANRMTAATMLGQIERALGKLPDAHAAATALDTGEALVAVLRRLRAAQFQRDAAIVRAGVP